MDMRNWLSAGNEDGRLSGQGLVMPGTPQLDLPKVYGVKTQIMLSLLLLTF
jgi:hypothetical protein